MYVYLHVIIVRITDAIVEKRKKRKVPSAIVDVRNARYGHPLPGRESRSGNYERQFFFQSTATLPVVLKTVHNRAVQSRDFKV